MINTNSNDNTSIGHTFHTNDKPSDAHNINHNRTDTTSENANPRGQAPEASKRRRLGVLQANAEGAEALLGELRAQGFFPRVRFRV